MGQQIYTSGSGTFTVPTGVTSLEVFLVSGGQGGYGSSGGGTGGNSVYDAAFSVSSGASLSYSVGTGGVGNTSGRSDSTSTSFSTMLAHYNSSASSVGANKYSGGGPTYAGGGSGGKSSNGNDAAGFAVGATAVTGGGSGGNAGEYPTGHLDGFDGGYPGGGAGAAQAGGHSGGTGGNGYIEINWTGGDEGDPGYGGSGGGGGVYNYNTWLTFRNVDIAKDAVINKAYIRFTAKSSAFNNDDDVLVMISAEAADSGTPPTSGSDANDKDVTDARINWDAIEHWTAESTYDSVDISCVIQEIVSRSGWTKGNDITLFVEDYNSGGTGLDQLRVAYSYDDDPDKAAEFFCWAVIPLEGQSDSTLTTSGDLTANKALIGTSASVLTVADSTLSLLTTGLVGQSDSVLTVPDAVLDGGEHFSGQSDSVCTTSGSLDLTLGLIGLSDSLETVDDTILGRSVSVEGQADCVLTVDGSLGLNLPVEGSSNSNLTVADCELLDVEILDGTSTSVLTVDSVQLNLSVGLSGPSAASCTSLGSLGINYHLIGTSNSVETLADAVLLDVEQCVGTSESTCTTSGELFALFTGVVGTSASTLVASGGLGIGRAIAGTSSSTCSINASINLPIDLGGTSGSTLSCAGSMPIRVHLTGLSASSMAQVGGLSVDPFNFQGTSASSCTTSAILIADKALEGTSSSTLVASGAASQGVLNLTGISAAVLSCAGSMPIKRFLTSVSTSWLDCDGNLTADKPLIGTSSSSMDAAGMLQNDVQLIGNSENVLSVTGSMPLRRKLSGVSASTCSISGDIFQDIDMTGQSSGSQFAQAELTSTRPLEGTCSSTLVSNGFLNIPLGLAGESTSSMGTAASIGWTVGLDGSSTSSMSTAGLAGLRRRMSAASNSTMSIEDSEIFRTRGLSGTSASNLTTEVSLYNQIGMTGSSHSSMVVNGKFFEHFATSIIEYLDSYKLYNTYAPREAVTPFIVFTFLEITHESWLGSSSGRAIAHVQFDVLADSKRQAKTIGNEITTLLSGYSGHMGHTEVQNISVIDTSDDVMTSNTQTVYTRSVLVEAIYEVNVALPKFTMLDNTADFEVALISYISPVASIFYGQLPKGWTGSSAVIYKQTGGADVSYLTDTITNMDRDYEFEVIGTSKKSCLETAAILRNRLDGLVGSVSDSLILESTLQEENESYAMSESNTPLHSITQSYEISVSSD